MSDNRSSDGITQDAKDMIQWVIDTCNEPENLYTSSKNDKGFKSFKKQTEEGQGVILLRADMFFEGITPEELYLMTTDFSLRKQWDELIADMEILEKIDSFSDIVYFNIPPPGFMVSQREFVNRRTRVKNYHGYDYVSVEKWAEHPSKPVTSKFVRAKMINSGTIVKRCENGCKANLIVQVNIGGLVPQWLVNMKADDGPYTFWKTVKKAYPRLKPQIETKLAQEPATGSHDQLHPHPKQHGHHGHHHAHDHKGHNAEHHSSH